MMTMMIDFQELDETERERDFETDFETDFFTSSTSKKREILRQILILHGVICGISGMG